MDFISWSVFGVLFILAESAIGNRYLLAIGLAFIYPAIADYLSVPMGSQLLVLLTGVITHVLFVLIFHKLRPARLNSDIPTDVGQRVEVIEWLGEGTARVMYHDKEWAADKARIEMPDADHGIIKAVQYGRLVITTQAPESDKKSVPA